MKARNVGEFLGKSRKKKKVLERVVFAPIQVFPSAPGQHKTNAHFKKSLKTGIYRDF